MASSGSFNLTRTGSTFFYVSFTCYWSQTKNDSDNSSSLNVWVNASKSSSSTAATYGSQTTTITVEGSSQSSTSSFTLNPGKMITLCDKNFTVSHNADGTKSVKITASVGGNVMWGSGSATVVLDTIPRGSVLGAISNFTLGNSITIPITKYASSFTDTLTISLNGTTIKTVSGITNNQSISFTDTELTNIYKLLPNTTSGTFTFKLTTKNGSTTVGTSSKTAKGTINTNTIRPSFPTYTVTEASDVVPSSWGIFVRNKSKLKFKITTTAGTGASITNITTTIDGNKYTGSEFETEIIKTSGSLTVDVSATDSRNITSSSAKSITIVDYDVPYITSATAIRSDLYGESDTGTYLRVDLKAGVYSVSNHNTAKFEVYYKKATASSWQVHTMSTTGLTYDGYVRIPAIDTNSSYEVKIVVTDYFGSVTKILPTVPTAFTTVDYLNGGHGMAIGKVAEAEDLLDIDFDVKVQKKLEVIGTATMANVGVTGELVKNNGYYKAYRGELADLNECLTHGYYTIGNGSTNRPSGSSSYGILDVVESRATTWIYSNMASWIWQTYYGTDGKIFQRHGVNDSSLGSWEKITKSISLYDNESGTTGTVTLSETSANFSYLEIYATSTDHTTQQMQSIKVYSPNGKKFSINSIQNGTNLMYITAKTYNISGTSITVSNASQTGTIRNELNSLVGLYETTKIIKVIGYR